MSEDALTRLAVWVFGRTKGALRYRIYLVVRTGLENQIHPVLRLALLLLAARHLRFTRPSRRLRWPLGSRLYGLGGCPGAFRARVGTRCTPFRRPCTFRF